MLSRCMSLPLMNGYADTSHLLVSQWVSFQHLQGLFPYWPDYSKTSTTTDVMVCS